MVRDLPPKTWGSSKTSVFLDARAQQLSLWIREVASIPFLVYFDAAKLFLGLDDASLKAAEEFVGSQPAISLSKGHHGESSGLALAGATPGVGVGAGAGAVGTAVDAVGSTEGGEGMKAAPVVV